MQRAYTPTSHRLGARAPVHLVAALRHRSTSSAAAVAAAAAAAPSPPPSGGAQLLRIRSRGYGPTSDLLKGIPENVELRVEATLHPEDAEVQRAVIAMSMPNLAGVRVTPVLPHGTYETKVPQHTGASYASDVISSAEREVMEECLHEQLAAVANLVVDQVEQRTGQQLDALHVTYTDKLKNFSEIVLNSIHDELRQLRVVRERQDSTGRGSSSAAHAPLPTSIDAEGVARLVSARVVQQLAGATIATASPSSTPASLTSSDVADQLTRLEASTAAHFEDLRGRISAAVAGHAVPAQASTSMELRAAVVEAVQKAAAEQQEKLSNFFNELLTERRVAMRGDGGDATTNSPVDMRAIEESVESAVQAATDELRRTISSEVKKLAKTKGVGGEAAVGAASDADMATEIERVFDVVQSTQSRLTAVDETVGDVYKEQAATRDALRSMQELLQRQLEELRRAVANAAVAPALPPAAASESGAAEAPQQKLVEVLEQLRSDVAATSATLAIRQDDVQQHLMTVAQVVSDSVAAAIQQHTEEAVRSAMSTIQEQLGALQEAASAVPSAPPPPAAVPQPAPLSQELLTDAVEAVLSPRWAELSVQVEKMNTASQLAIEQQLLHIADSVSTSVSASLQTQLEELRTAAQSSLQMERAKVEKSSAVNNTSAVEAAELIEKMTREFTALREELLQTLRTQLGSTPELNLTPMYKYIDSVLTFMKEELSLQETNMTAKMTSLAETVTAAVHEQQAIAASSASLSKKQKEPTAQTSKEEAWAAKATATSDAPPPAAAATLLGMGELLSPVRAALEGYAAALRRLEGRLDEVGHTSDVRSVLTRLQEATEQFSSASAAAAHAQKSERDALQALLQDRFISLTQSLEARDAQVMEAVRAAVTTEQMRTQLSGMQNAIESLSQTQKEELLSSMREAVADSEREQAQRTDAFLARMTAMQEALQEQHVAVQLLKTSPALVGLSPEQQRDHVRIRTATRDRLRHVTRLISEVASAPTGKGARAAAKALEDQLAGLRQLEEEEADLLRETSVTDAGPVTVQSVVQAEVQRVQEEVQKGIQELSGQGKSVQRDIAAAVQSLVAKINDVESNTSSLPALSDIQQLMDATIVRVTSEQREEGSHVSELVQAATARSAVELKTAVQTALAENASAVEKHLIPSYHATMESMLQTHLTAHSTEIKAVAHGVADTTSAAVQRMETIAQNMESRHASVAHEHTVSHSRLQRHLRSFKPTAHVPLWWLIANPLLVCLMVLLSIYYVFACLLLAFVPKPLEKASGTGDGAAAAAALDLAADPQMAKSSSAMLRKGGRYVDRYM
ncbi:hypothetical protein LSCM1_05975 [Leishmania martiniquensis]|uniref:Uncharacterized protein n=1 Tax=Leishmania martiniquensis TaxID=1580590 RepID=A0A836HWF2_9TRYP|nr:hypothetical protein LSCM1_05975 [Leishmania martiniquensis]